MNKTLKTKTPKHSDGGTRRSSTQLCSAVFSTCSTSQSCCFDLGKVSEQFDIEKVTLRHNIEVNLLITGKLIGDLENPSDNLVFP